MKHGKIGYAKWCKNAGSKRHFSYDGILDLRKIPRLATFCMGLGKPKSGSISNPALGSDVDDARREAR